jgi:NAD+ synthase
MKTSERIDYIKKWIVDYCESMSKKPDSLIIGISGGIDSSVTSTICALTGKKTIVLSIPIKQIKEQHDLSIKHQNWLKEKFKNVEGHLINLDLAFETFKHSLSKFHNEHGLANTKARLRMVTLYQVAAANNGIVVGTGNKVEDFGVGFYTKYGDGGVDISPIADCTKTQVWKLGEHLGISKEIVKADPTDGLWEDGRPDVSQLGMSYQDLEKAMIDFNNPGYKKYLEIRNRNLHKMKSIPICKMKND